MSILAYVLCVLLVATATTATDDLSDSERRLDTLDAVTKETMERYEFAKNTVNEILSQMKLEEPFDIDTWTPVGHPPGAECYELLRKNIATHRSRVVECSKSIVEVVNIEHEKLEKLSKPTLKSVDDLKSFGERCLLWADLFRDAADKAAMCMDEVHQEIEAINRRDYDAIKEIVHTARLSANLWAVDVSHCVASNEERSSMMEWQKACMDTL